MTDIRRYEEKDLAAYIKLCKKSYEAHNVFFRKDSEIIDYLKSKDVKHEYGGLFLGYDEKLTGGSLMEVKEQDGKGHVRFQYNHVVAVNDKVRKELLDFMDGRIRELKTGKIKTAKVEVKLAETENLDFYLSNGFTVEGQLSSHYRPDEKVYVLGKNI